MSELNTNTQISPSECYQPLSSFPIDSNFQTPKNICDYMVSMVPENAFKILEPTPGLGNIVKSLEDKNRYQIITADDFFLLDKNEKYECIVMNPPFSSKSAFIENAPEEAETKGM